MNCSIARRSVFAKVACSRPASHFVRAILLLFLVPNPLVACVSFPTTSNLATGSYPMHSALVDLNRDGKLDLVGADYNAHQLSIRQGNGDGTFGSASTVAVSGTLPAFVATADFNGDGRPDLATANNGNATISILLATGDATFAAPVSYSVGDFPYSIATGDFNRDGKIDLAVPGSANNTITILIGSGTGTFTAGTPLTVSSPVFAVAADFNRDGFTDLAVSRSLGNAIAIFTGNGAGGFSAGSTLATGANAWALAQGDFNRDGRVDLAVTNANAASLSIFTGNGDATFASLSTPAVGSDPRGLVVADLTGDGRQDLAVANRAADSISLLVATGDATFAAAVTIAGGDGGHGITAARLNSDRLPDLVISNTNANTVSIRINASACNVNCGEYTSLPAVSAASPRRSATADFNRDGKLDLAVPLAGSSAAQIFTGDGAGGFVSAGTLGTVPPSVAVTGDFNRDGIADLAVGGGGGVSVFRGVGDATFLSSTPITIAGSTSGMAVADLNQDGILDLIAAQANAPATSFFQVFLGVGDATFTAGSTYNLTVVPQRPVLGDVNRDGRVDVVIVSPQAGFVTLRLGNGDGTFGSATTVSMGSGSYDGAIADLNRDGRPDLAVASAGSSVVIVNGNGDGTFGSPASTAVGGIPFGLELIDSGQGRTSLVAAVPSQNDAAVLIIDASTGAVTAVRHQPVGTSPYFVSVGDFNRDGRDDFAVSNVSSNNLSIVENYCNTSVTLASGSNPSDAGRLVMLTATLAATPGNPSPTGTITFKDDGTTFASGSVPGSLTSGVGKTFSIGTHAVTAEYSGDFSYAASTSNTIQQTAVLAPPQLVYTHPTGLIQAGVPQSPRGSLRTLAAPEVVVLWSAVPGSDSYEVFRATNVNGPFTTIGSTTSLQWPDTNVASNVTYIYKVRTIDNGTPSSDSALATGTILTFTDEALTPTATVIKRAHLTELRSAVNLVRAAANLGAYSFAEPVPAVIKRSHVVELETALLDVYPLLGWPSFTPTAITPFVTKVYAATIARLRIYVRSGPTGGPQD